MKKLFFVLAVGSLMGLASCSKDCVDCSGVTGYSGKICKSDYEAGAGKVQGAPSWDTYSSTLKAAGCK